MSWLSRPKSKPSLPPKLTPSQEGIPTVRPAPGRPALTPPAAPKKRGKTPEQWVAELAIYHQAMRKHFADIAAFERERRIGLGITRYKWIAVDVHGTCDVAKRNGAKVFSHGKPPKEGHIREGQGNSPDWCRCFAKPVIPGFDD